MKALSLAALCAFAGASATGAAAHEEDRLGHLPAAANDELGHSVSLYGDVAVAGARLEDQGSLDAGAAYVFERNGDHWDQTAHLTASDASGGDQFGFATAIYGDTVVLGAPFDDDAGADSGSAYVFVRTGTTLVEEARLVADDGGAHSWFGYSVAIDRDRILVGAPYAQAAGSRAGAAYVFARSGTTWTQEAKLIGADPAANDTFGLSVALDGHRAVAGAPGDAEVGPDSGSTLVFMRQGVQWNLQARLVPADAAAGDYFGRAVAVSADAIAVGAPYVDGGAPYSGATYLFHRTGTSWSEISKLTPAQSSTNVLFGSAVALSVDVLLVGSPWDPFAGSQTGAMYVFLRGFNSWTLKQKLTASDATSGDLFGMSVAAFGCEFVAGAPRHDVSDMNTGEAYVYADVLLPESYCQGKTNSIGCVPHLSFTGQPSATSTAAFRITAHDLVPQEIGYFVYSTQGRLSLAFHNGTLCVKAPTARLFPPQSAASTGPFPCRGRVTRDFNPHIQSGANPLLVPGQRVFTQFRQRDPTLADGFGDGFSDALEFVVCP